MDALSGVEAEAVKPVFQDRLWASIEALEVAAAEAQAKLTAQIEALQAAATATGLELAATKEALMSVRDTAEHDWQLQMTAVGKQIAGLQGEVSILEASCEKLTASLTAIAKGKK